MTDSYDAHDAPAPRPASPDQSEEGYDLPVYPEQHVVAVVETGPAAGAALDALAGAGFLESELRVLHGPDEAERLEAGTGRRGLLDRVLRFAERIGIRNDELAAKNQYEDALRNGGYVVLVLAPTDERKDRAATLLAARGARLVNYFGRFAIERLSA